MLVFMFLAERGAFQVISGTHYSSGKVQLPGRPMTDPSGTDDRPEASS